MRHRLRWRRIGVIVSMLLLLGPAATRTTHAACSYIGNPYGDIARSNDCAIDAATRTSPIAPTQPNTPADSAWLKQWSDYQTQQSQIAEQNAIAAVLSPSSDVSYYQNQLNAASDAFYGRSPTGNPSDNLFNTPYYSGPAMPVIDTSITNTPNFVPDFLRSLNITQNSTTTPSTPINYTQLNPPGSCSIGDPYQPTTITIYNLTLRPVLVELADTRCQEIPYILLPPQTSFLSLTFVGQTWRFRDGLTGAYLLGEPQFVIPNAGPQTYTVISLASTGQLRAETGAQAALAANPNLPTIHSSATELAQQLAAMRERQIDQVYDDPALQALQLEASKHMLMDIYADPLALYLRQERDSLNEQIQASSPDFAKAKALAAEIASWTDVPSDPAVLSDRYAKRAQLPILTAHVDDDTATYLLQHPNVAAQLHDLNQRLQQQVDDLTHTPQELLWQADWQQRWNLAYYTSKRGISEIQNLLDIQTNYPDFAEYQQLNNQVGDMLPSLSAIPPVQHITDLQQQADSNLDARAKLRALTDQFHTMSAAAINHAGAATLLEQFYERVNALGASDPDYASLRAAGETAESNLAAFREQVHTAVANCYASSGDACDPASDRAARGLVQSPRVASLVQAIATFHQQHDAFWHSFYSSKGYLDLENQAKAELQAPLSAAQAGLDAARSAYEQSQNAIPAFKTLHTAQQSLYSDLCSASVLNSLPVADPTTALCSRLSRMATLARGFRASSSTQSVNTLYLPLIAR